MSIRSSAIGLAVVIVLMGAGAAQSLSGSNTVFSDDIAPGQVRGSDLAANSVYGSKILNSSVTGADINESTLAIPKVHTTAVANNGSKSFGDGTSSRASLGIYSVDYGFPVSQCTAQVTPGFVVGGGSNALLTNGAFPGANSSPNAVRVEFYDPNFSNVNADTAFFLTLVCP